jgi:hypothetical protein
MSHLELEEKVVELTASLQALKEEKQKLIEENQAKPLISTSPNQISTDQPALNTTSLSPASLSTNPPPPTPSFDIDTHDTIPLLQKSLFKALKCSRINLTLPKPNNLLQSLMTSLLAHILPE